MVYQLRYRVELKDQAVFSQLGGDPNRVESEGYVPGSAIYGALAGLVIQELGLNNKAHENELFRRWFLREGLRCLNAYPVDEDQKIRLLPVPLSIQKEKSNESELHDLVRYLINDDEDDNKELFKKQPKSLEGFGQITGDGKTLYLTKTKTQYNYHTTRSQDRRKGRATEGEGAVFVYEALEAGQTFEGLILGEKDDLAKLQERLKWKKGESLPVRLGRSRSTQYGGSTKLELVSDEPEEFISEVETKAGVETDSGLVVLTLTSHLLLRGENGYPAHILTQIQENKTGTQEEAPLLFPVEQLATALGLSQDDLKLKHSFARRELIGGYSSVWGLPRPQWPAFKAGSVFVFEVKGVPNLTEAEKVSLGLRTGEGYGRFVLNWHGKEKTLTLGNNKIIRDDKPPKPSTLPDAFTKLVRDVVSKEYERQAESKARDYSTNFSNSPTFKITPALLGRLQQALHKHTNSEEMLKWLKDLRRPAKQQLERLRHKDKDENGWSLLDQIESILQETKSVYNIPRTGSIGLSTETQQVIDVTNQSLETDGELLNRVKQVYLLTLIGELSRAQRRQEKREDGGE
jgi:CRISPR-associated protein Csx10